MAFRFDPNAGRSSSEDEDVNEAQPSREDKNPSLNIINQRERNVGGGHVKEKSGQSFKQPTQHVKERSSGGASLAVGTASSNKKSNYAKYIEQDEDERPAKKVDNDDILSPEAEDAAAPIGPIEWTRQEELGVLDMYNLDDLNPQEWTEFSIAALANEKNAAAAAAASLAATQSNESISASASKNEETKRLHLEVDNPAHASLFHIAEELQDDDDPLGVIRSDVSRQVYFLVCHLNDSLIFSDIRAGAKRQMVPLHKTISDISMNHRAVSLSSRSFDPKLFLLEVHGSSSFADLIEGAENLKRNISHRQELSRKLVKQNFYRFVTAKALVDSKPSVSYFVSLVLHFHLI